MNNATRCSFPLSAPFRAARDDRCTLYADAHAYEAIMKSKRKSHPARPRFTIENLRIHGRAQAACRLNTLVWPAFMYLFEHEYKCLHISYLMEV